MKKICKIKHFGNKLHYTPIPLNNANTVKFKAKRYFRTKELFFVLKRREKGLDLSILFVLNLQKYFTIRFLQIFLKFFSD